MSKSISRETVFSVMLMFSINFSAYASPLINKAPFLDSQCPAPYFKDILSNHQNKIKKTNKKLLKKSEGISERSKETELPKRYSNLA